MAVQLEYLLAGVGRRRREQQGEALVDGLAVGIAKGRQGRHTGCGLPAQQCLGDLRGGVARDPDDADPAAAGRGALE